MQILVACEESQAVTIALRKLGHEAYSCDLIPCSGGHPEWHIQQDVLPLLNGYCFFKTCDGSAHYVLGRWDMLIAFPPCTYLTNASAVRMRVKGEIVAERYAKAMEAKAFFMSFLSADCAKIAVENPTPLKIVELPPYTQAIQPWQFGHPYTKRTCLWLKELPLLVPTEIITEGVTPWVNGGLCRWGTTCKLRTIDQYAERQGAKVYVGIAADETPRLQKERKPYKLFPLAEFGRTEADCLQYCYSAGYFWLEGSIRLYDILDRVSCWCCCNKNLKELRNIRQYLPEYWEKLKHLQAQLERPMKGFYKDQPRGVFELDERFAREDRDT